MSVEASPTSTNGSPPEEMPRVALTRDRMILLALFVASALAFLYFVLPKIAGLGHTWHRIRHGDPLWLGAAVGFEVLSFLGYVALFRIVFVRGESRVGWRESYQITMAGVAATRLFAAAGAGGIALTAWALRRSGMSARLVACRITAFMTLLYGVYVGTVVIVGTALYMGVLNGGEAFSITLLPALLGLALLGLFGLISLVPAGFERRVQSRAADAGRLGKLARRLATAPDSLGSGVRTAIALVRSRNPLLLGAVAWWAFDIATLYAAFRAFGNPPPAGVIIMAYFLGMIGNLLPLPGGIGGVDGGMIGVFVAFDVNTGLAIVAVLAYRALAFWLPTVPGIIAYLQLRRTVSRWDEGDSAAAEQPAASHPSYT
jgi:uncharacterized protein (TIRG00374 family)